MTNTIIILVVASILLFFLVVYNSLITAKNRIAEALSQIDIQLKRRTDLIPNLLETVKGFAKHEKTLLENVTKARTSLMTAGSTHDKAEANNLLTESLKSLFAVSENYPDLKSSQNFIELQKELSDTENKLAYSRQFYNANVLDFNNKLNVFPSNIVGGLFNFKVAEFFQTEEADKKPVKVNF